MTLKSDQALEDWKRAAIARWQTIGEENGFKSYQDRDGVMRFRCATCNRILRAGKCPDMACDCIENPVKR